MRVKGKIAFTSCPIDKWGREHEITTDQLSILRKLIDSIEGDRLNKDQNTGMTNLYNEIFGMRKSVSSCNSCVAQIVNDLKKVLESYEG